MSGAISRYLAAVQRELHSLDKDELPALEQAADRCAEALAARKVIHLFDTGHLISHELVARTGGLVAYTPLTFRGVLESHNRWRASRNEAVEGAEDAEGAEQALLRWVFAQGTLREGDVLIVGSVSGTSLRVVELAMEARARGLTVIGLTAPAFSQHLQSHHPSGKRLFEVADLVLDNHAGYGDSFFAVDGLEPRVCPLSGISSAVLMWALTAGIAERLLARGLVPSVYTSVNLPGGPAAVDEVESRYAEKGY